MLKKLGIVTVSLVVDVYDMATLLTCILPVSQSNVMGRYPSLGRFQFVCGSSYCIFQASYLGCHLPFNISVHAFAIPACYGVQIYLSLIQVSIPNNPFCSLVKLPRM